MSRCCVWTMAKRFEIETSSNDQKFSFISESTGSKLLFANVGLEASVKYTYKEGKRNESDELDLIEFIDIKGWRAMGNKVGDFKVTKVDWTPTEELKFEEKSTEKKTKPDKDEGFIQGDLFGNSKSDKGDDDGLKAGDTIDFEV